MLHTIFRTDPSWGLFDRQVDRMLHEIARPIRTQPAAPRVHVREDDAGIQLIAEVPGLRAEDIEIHVTRDTLTLRGQRRVAVPEGRQVLRRERPDVSFDATYRFANDVDPDRVVAKVVDGLLTISAPAAKKVEPKKITVQVR
jgi:HSP20 family protein